MHLAGGFIGPSDASHDLSLSRFPRGLYCLVDVMVSSFSPPLPRFLRPRRRRYRTRRQQVLRSATFSNLVVIDVVVTDSQENPVMGSRHLISR